ncbi:MAG: hypothetical protein UV73_C0008G0035 [Candidatus Gottesmanbacteria bacterium GW2011_GWA2_43_14]|uniref:Uncharacterized protein n=1 Tax=Candidatus Gottesmanbacteria bacterium GW2011_GWA2_43_14 TaxID=1618443 RepID=A0A0G1DI50_9BACT|nr:MAG: hypothetical protein UV73_C0008G0035 [Candidatus Gottesmanbacteria bacterium GW2011_GWA2_43_14]
MKIISEKITLQKKRLARRWFKFSLIEQMANIGSEVERAIKWKEKGKAEIAEAAFFRALELLDLTINGVGRDEAKLKELCRAKEFFCDFFIGKNQYYQTKEMWQKYFYHFTYAARLHR